MIDSGMQSHPQKLYPWEIRKAALSHQSGHPPLPELLWWVEINTVVPLCTYFFGPFDSRQEAQDSRLGYVNDLCQEQARGIVAQVKQCQPTILTIDQGYYPNQSLTH